MLCKKRHWFLRGLKLVGSSFAGGVIWQGRQGDGHACVRVSRRKHVQDTHLCKQLVGQDVPLCFWAHASQRQEVLWAERLAEPHESTNPRWSLQVQAGSTHRGSCKGEAICIGVKKNFFLVCNSGLTFPICSHHNERIYYSI